MSVKKFKFVSPGIFVNEIDNSQLPDDSTVLGPLIIGRAEHGPALRPVKVSSFSDFVDTFGKPVAGGRGADVWRDGNYTSTMYATFAAQAYLRNNSPITYVRLLGAQHQNASSAGRAGWKTDAQISDALTGGAYGLFLIDSGSVRTRAYVDVAFIDGSGSAAHGGSIHCATGSTLVFTTSSAGSGVGTNEFAVRFTTASTSTTINRGCVTNASVAGSSNDFIASPHVLLNVGTDANTTAGKQGTVAQSFIELLGLTTNLTGVLLQDGYQGHGVADSREANRRSDLGTGSTVVRVYAKTAGLAGNDFSVKLTGSNRLPRPGPTGTQIFETAAGAGIFTAGDGSWTTPGGAAVASTTPDQQTSASINLSGSVSGPGMNTSVSFIGGNNGVQQTLTGTLAAVWYFNEGKPRLKGNIAGTTTEGSGSSTFIESVGASKTFKIVFEDSSATKYKETSFNFDENSDKYVRKVFNTNPTLVNSSTNTSPEKYWLGETFERMVTKYITGSTSNKQLGILLPLMDDNGSFLSSADQSVQTRATVASRTGWVISQDLNTNNTGFNPTVSDRTQNLFRFHSRETGEWEQNNLKISVTNIKKATSKYSEYGKFDILVRKVDDTDSAIKVLERFSNCSLNPESPDYVARKIGDKYTTWSDDDNRFREYGVYDNRSKYIRLEVNGDVDNGLTRADLLPFGYYGPPQFKGVCLTSGSTAALTYYRGTGNADDHTHEAPFVEVTGTLSHGAGSTWSNETTSRIMIGETTVSKHLLLGGVGASYTASSGYLPFTGSFLFPALQLRGDTLSGSLPDPKKAFWGIDTTQAGSSVEFDRSYVDTVRAKPYGVDSFAVGAGVNYSFVFTLDDLVVKTNSAGNATNHFNYVSGSRTLGNSYTATSGGLAILDKEMNKFTMPLFGGFDGLDIREKDPFRNSILANATSETENYPYYTLQRVIRSVSDAEVVEYNLAMLPGVTDTKVTDQLINVCEDRADALAIIDLPGDYTSEYEGTSDEASRVGSVATTINNLNSRALNTSYACAYYPWVQVRDEFTNKVIWMPPSVVALGTLGSSAARSELWFAPAGFVRGGLSEGSAGIPVVGVRQKLTSTERDQLYSANVNPIASFPSEGIVVFGQKTLQVTPSALDRINVRRALIFIKKEISRVASTILFEQNVQATWNRFLDTAEPFLASVKSRLGLDDYKLVLDETTTTDDLMDRNVVYAKVFLKPAKAIEFIAIDFTISNTGAAFED